MTNEISWNAIHESYTQSAIAIKYYRNGLGGFLFAIAYVFSLLLFDMLNKINI